MNPPTPAHIAEWRAKARLDWSRISRQLAESDASLAGMILQQSPGKYLKADLLARGWTLTRTHRLPRLLAEAVAHDAGLAAYRDLCDRITDWYMADRYPDAEETPPTEADVRADLAKARALIVALFPDESLALP